MSTKIYTGYRLAAGTDIWAFTEKLREQGNTLRNQLDLNAIERFGEGAEVERVGQGEGAFPKREGFLMAGYLGWDKLMRDLGESRLSDPHQLSATFIRDPKTDRILALLYAGAKMQHVFIDQPEVEYFGYWNNTDPDSDCTEEEWAEREETWERCLGGDPPIRRGISFDLRAGPTDGIIEMIYGLLESPVGEKA